MSNAFATGDKRRRPTSPWARSNAHCRAALVLTLSIGVPLRAQPTTSLAISSGAVTDQRGVRSNATTLTPSVSGLASPWLRYSLNGSATRYGPSVNALGAGASLLARTPSAGGFAISASGSGTFSRTSYDARFASVNATPALEWSNRNLSTSAGWQIASGSLSARNDGSFPSTPLLPLPGATSTSNRIGVTRRADGPTASVLWQPFLTSPTRVLQFTARVAEWRLREPVSTGSATGLPLSSPPATSTATRTVNFRDTELGGVAVLNALTLQLIAGQRHATDEERGYLAAGASYAFTPQLAVTFGGGTYPSDRLTGTSGGRYVTAGVNVSIGRSGAARSGAAARLPAARGVDGPAVGTTRLTIAAPHATRVELAGDWNNWQRVTAQRARDDVWYVDVPLAPGEYRYAFVIDGTSWRVPEGAVSADDGFGSKVAWVTVRSRAE